MVRKKAGLRLSVYAAVATVAEKRSIWTEIGKKFSEEGWRFLRKNETVDIKEGDSAMSNFPVHGFRWDSSATYILKAILPNKLV